MTPKQTGLREVSYPLADEPKVIGLVELGTGHVVVPCFTLDRDLGIKTVGFDVRFSRIAECHRRSGPKFHHRSQRVVGLDGLEWLLSRRFRDFGFDDSRRIVEWFRSQGLSPTLWPASSDIDKACDSGRLYYRPDETGKRSLTYSENKNLAASLAALDFSELAVAEPVNPEPEPAKAVEPAVYPYWICC